MIYCSPSSQHQGGIEYILAGEPAMDPPTNDRDSPFAQQRDQADDWVAAVFGSDREHLAVLLVSPEDAEAAAARFGENRRVLTPMMTAGIGRRSSS